MQFSEDFCASVGNTRLIRLNKASEMTGCEILGKAEFLNPGGSVKDRAALFMAEAPFAGRVPVFIGDDVTDEDGFAAVNRLGGHSIRVGNDDATEARWRIAGVQELCGWLGDLARAGPEPVSDTEREAT